MIYGSICSGIESATVAWHPLGWSPAFFAENSKFPSAVLAHHYPTIPNYGDITKFKEWPDANIDVLVGGTPCQSFSIAGLRKGLDDPRGNLMLTYLAIAERYRPKWPVWENVPGVLSSNDGRDFGAFLGGLGKLGYGFAYRVLDAQYFELAQRRARVFVVGYLGDWRRAAAVLFESESLRWDPAPSREAGKRLAATLTRGAESGGKGGYAGRRQEDDVNIVACLDASYGRLQGCSGQDLNHGHSHLLPQTASTITGGGRKNGGYSNDDVQLIPCDQISHALTATGFDSSEDGTGRGTPIIPVAYGGGNLSGPIDVGTTLLANGSGRLDFESETFICFDARQDPCVYGDLSGALSAQSPQSNAIAFQGSGTNLTVGDITGTSRTNGSSASGAAHMTCIDMAVRRLTPVECARLQGFPDRYLDIIYNGKPSKDGPKYQALGNSKAVPVVRWIGKRIQMVDNIITGVNNEVRTQDP